MAALVKATSFGDVPVPPGQQVFFRSIFALPVILGWLVFRAELGVGLITFRPMGHFYRGIIGTAAMGLNFWALSLLPFPEATAIGYAAPLMVVVFAGMFLGENVRVFRLSMVGLGLVGVLIVLSPQLSGAGSSSTVKTLGAVVALMGASCAALAQIFVRKLVQDERTSAIVFWFSVTSSLLSLLTLPLGWVVPHGATLAMLIMTGILGGLGQILLTSSYRFADASVIAPFEYVSMVLAVFIGWTVFGEMPTVTVVSGACVVILAGILIIWREHRLGLERTRQRRAGTPHS
jgi:drug/metabolite transporter (DMT)-like permease